MAFIITEKLVMEIDQELSYRGKGMWRSHDFEIQAGGEELLIRVYIDEQTSIKVMRQIFDLMKDVVGSRIPPKKLTCSWMCVIKANGEVVSSVFADILPDDNGNGGKKK